jgi:C4-dicarboxylate transporter
MSAIGTAQGAGHALRRASSPLVLPVGVRRPRAVAMLAVAEALRLLDNRRPRASS